MQAYLSQQPLLYSKLFGDFLFWLHAGIIIGGVAMGIFLPLQLVLALVLLHRLHLMLFKGCLLSKLQSAAGHLPPDTNYLQQLMQTLFRVSITQQQAQTFNNWIGGITIFIAFAYSPSAQHFQPVLVFACALLGALVSYKLWQAERKNNYSQVCSTKTLTCQLVAKSRYATIFGVPVALLGTAYFLAVTVAIALSFFLGIDIGLLLVSVASVGAVTSVYFVYTQLGKLKQICGKCMISHVASFGLFIVANNFSI